MDRDDPNDPLSGSFDPNRLKVPELRSLLFRHDVRVPSNARKAALIQAYEDNIRSNAADLRAARNRDLNIRPDGREIVYLSNGQAQRSPSVSEREDLQGRKSSPAKGRARRSVSWAESVQSDDEIDSQVPEPSSEAASPAHDASADVSTFSIDNPFQTHRSSGARKSSTPRKGRASEPMKKETALQAMKKRPAGGRHSMPQSRRRATSSEDETEADDSNLDADNTRSSAVSPLVQKQRRIRQWVDHAKTDYLGSGGKGGEEADGDSAEEGTLLGFLSFAASIAVLAWWVWFARESHALGFCDTGRSSNAIQDLRTVNRQAARLHASEQENTAKRLLLQARLPDQLRPSCLACPVHASCSQGRLTGCESDEYVLQAPISSHLPLSRFLLPLSRTAPSCNPDEEKLLLAADLADEIENRLRRFKADVYCNRKRARLGPRDEPEWGPEGVYAMPLSDVYHDLRMAAGTSSALRTHGEDFFRQLWDLAMSDLEASGRAQQRSSRILATRGPVGVGLRCRAGLAASGVWRRSRVWLAVLLTSLLLSRWLLARVRGTSLARKQAQELTQLCLTRLRTVKRRHVHAIEMRSGPAGTNSPGGAEPFLSVAQLRDILLRDEHNPTRRKTLWAKVSRLAESNTNVRTRQAKVQGEWARVWEWVGPVDDGEEVNAEMVQRGTPAASKSIASSSANKTPPTPASAVSKDARGRWGADDVKPERPLLGDEYNAGVERRPSAEI